MDIKFKTETKVYLEGVNVGNIKEVEGGFCYQPKSSSGDCGETFPTLEACKWENLKKWIFDPNEMK